LKRKEKTVCTYVLPEKSVEIVFSLLPEKQRHL